MFEKIMDIYGKILKVINILFGLLVFLALSDLVLIFISYIGISYESLTTIADVVGFFTACGLMFLIKMTFLLIIVPLNFLYLPIYCKKIKNSGYSLQKMNLRESFKMATLFKKITIIFLFLVIIGGLIYLSLILFTLDLIDLAYSIQHLFIRIIIKGGL